MAFLEKEKIRLEEGQLEKLLDLISKEIKIGCIQKGWEIIESVVYGFVIEANNYCY